MPAPNRLAPSMSTGNGLAGLRERVAVAGGDFVAGPTDTGGFRVAARLPVAEVADPAESRQGTCPIGRPAPCADQRDSRRVDRLDRDGPSG